MPAPPLEPFAARRLARMPRKCASTAASCSVVEFKKVFMASAVTVVGVQPSSLAGGSWGEPVKRRELLLCGLCLSVAGTRYAAYGAGGEYPVSGSPVS
jgi:hypothetical protein